MKESLIREIYFGTYDPGSGRRAHNDAFGEIVAMYEAMMKEVPESFRESFRHFGDQCLNLLCDRGEEAFQEGYRLGVRLMVEALADSGEE